MKKITIIISMLFIAGFLPAQEMVLSTIIPQIGDGSSNPVIQADQQGGTISFNVPYRQGCTGSYALRWRFSRDLTQLKAGDEFDVTLECVNCQTPCGYRKTSGLVTGSNNILSIPGVEMTYNGNIREISKQGSLYTWSQTESAKTYRLKYDMFKSVKTTAFVIIVGPHRINYVFSTDPVSQGPVNCHTLLGLGHLVGNLITGAFESYGWEWMVETIDYALNHVVASNCISSSYLLDLKKRITGTTSTNSFLEEIRTYSASLEIEAAGCDCCNSGQSLSRN